jgi:hypothetical protein
VLPIPVATPIRIRRLRRSRASPSSRSRPDRRVVRAPTTRRRSVSMRTNCGSNSPARLRRRLSATTRRSRARATTPRRTP